MENNKKKSFHLIQAARLYLIAPLVIFVVLLILLITLAILYVATYQKGFLIALVAIFGIFFVAYVFIGYYLIKRIHKMYYEQIYGTTYENIKRLTNSDTNLESYKQTDIQEIEELNDAMQEIKQKFENAYLLVKEPDYSKLSLVYVDESKHLITFDSFKKNLRNIIFLSQNYRNLLIEVFYNLPDQELSQEEIDRIINLYYQLFKGYKNSLYMAGEGKKSILIYLPVIDSFNGVKEQIESAISDSSIIIRDVHGLEHVNAQIAIVAYPYSDEDYILSDLRYAKRQNKSFNLFLPNRTKITADQNLLMNTSMNINYMSKLMSKISDLEYHVTDSDKSKENIKSLLTDLSNYLNIDEAGVIYFDSMESGKYKNYVMTENSTIFKNMKTIDSEFVSVMNNSADYDDSYYFSCRKNASNLLGRHLDYYGISSGYYYVIKNADKEIVGVIYLFNKRREFVFDSYIRETFYVLSLRIAHYFESRNHLESYNRETSEKEYIMSMADYLSYRVDDNFNLVYLSKDMKKVFPDAKVGMPCYKALYGSERLCSDCPMRTFKKKEVNVKTTNYIESLVLNDRKSHSRSLLLEKLHNKEQQLGDLFDKEFLTYSYFSLFNALRNEYYANGRGYVVLLSIDNSEDLIANQGSEGFKFVMRCFIRKIKNKFNIEDVYMYNPTTLAIHFPYIGHADIINNCEKIYEISKENYFDDGSKDQLNVTYLPVGYPRGYANVEDFIKHLSDFYHSDRYERNKDFIFFSDFSISRSASKRDFVVSVIQNEFSSRSTNSVNLQPIVQVKDRHIYGAEILLRINDEHRNVFFNAQEISNIAEQENMTYLITESIVNFVGELYKEHGKSTFKNNDFKRIAINIDQTYLRDPSLIQNVIRICETNHIPNNFISFEVPEDIIPDNIDKIRRFADELKNYHIYFSCDRFTGQYIGSEKLKDLGFNEVKIARDLILKIDKDPVQLNGLKEIVNNAHSVGINVAAVGVENEAQYKILRDLDNNMVVQGYLLYKPLTRSDLISAIISYTD